MSSIRKNEWNESLFCSSLCFLPLFVQLFRNTRGRKKTSSQFIPFPCLYMSECHALVYSHYLNILSIIQIPVSVRGAWFFEVLITKKLCYLFNFMCNCHLMKQNTSFESFLKGEKQLKHSCQLSGLQGFSDSQDGYVLVYHSFNWRLFHIAQVG